MTKVKQQVVEMLQDIPDDKVTAIGIFKEYANSDLVSKEKGAWGEAVREKHANH